MSNNIGNNNMNPTQSIGSGLSASPTVQGALVSTSVHQQNVSSMEVDPGIPTNPIMASTPNLPSLTPSSPGLGNLQSVMGSGTTNIVSSSPVTPMSQHSSLGSALQGGSPNTISSINNISATSMLASAGSVLGSQSSLGMQSTLGTQSSHTTPSSFGSQSSLASLASQSPLGSQIKTPSSSSSSHEISSVILTRPRLQDLVREVDPTEQLDEEVEELLLQLADDFVESTVSAACLLAKHRKATTVEVKDVQLHLERQWNMWIPGFGTDELRPYKRAPVTEAHKQRLALIRKAIKKY